MKGEQGYTLLELLLALAVIGVIFTLVTPGLNRLYQRYELDIAARTLAVHIRSEQAAARAHQDTHLIWMNSFQPRFSVWEGGNLVRQQGFPERVQYRNGYLEQTVTLLRFSTEATTGSGRIRLVNKQGQQVEVIVQPVTGAVMYGGITR